jgi:hypothetical protein
MRIYFREAMLAVSGWAVLGARAQAGSTHSTVLTDINFDSTVSTGTWLILHTSPYCSHCRAFAPTWDYYLEVKAQEGDFPGVTLAKVDCSSAGGPCSLTPKV